MADIRSRLVEQIPRRYARALTRDVAAADDLVQDCLIRAVRKSHLSQEGTNLRAWVFTILHNEYVNQVRRTVREGTAVALRDVDTDPVLTWGPNQGSTGSRTHSRQVAGGAAVGAAVVGMEGMNYNEAAVVLDVPAGTIRSRLSRGREALRQMRWRGTEQEEAGLDADGLPRRVA
jgi:RNA polymerase sigma-70 factor, ECF subfamily